MSDRVPIDLKNCTVKIIDGTPVTPLEVILKIDEGNATFSVKKNREYKKDRGVLDVVRDGDEEPMDLSIDARFSGLIADGAESLTLFEILNQTGGASAWVSTGGECEPYCVDVVIEMDSGCAGFEDETFTFPEFRYETMGGDFKAGTMSVSGKCNATVPTGVRAAV